MPVQTETKPVNEGDCADVQSRLGHICHTGEVGLQALRDDPQKNPQHQFEYNPVALHEVAQPLRSAQVLL